MPRQRVAGHPLDEGPTPLRILIAATALLLVQMPHAGSAGQSAFPRGSIVESVNRLPPGGYLWAPEVSPQGPLLLAVSLAKQRAILYRNGVPIAVSTVSTGRRGHETPVGVFTILEKQVHHKSNLYDSAPMPFMQRLTWDGVALHAGKLPGYPASHGCIRLPAGFAKLLFGQTHRGMTVVVTDQPALPRVAPRAALLKKGTSTPGVQGKPEWTPERSPAGPISIIVSAADRKMVVLRSGVIIGSTPIEVTAPIRDTSAYALRSRDATGLHWFRIGLPGRKDAGSEASLDSQSKIVVPEAFRERLAALVEPGTTTIITPDSLVAGSTGNAVTLFESDAAPQP